MKKRFLLLFLLGIFATSSVILAQEDDKRIHIYVKGGVNMSKFAPVKGINPYKIEKYTETIPDPENPDDPDANIQVTFDSLIRNDNYDQKQKYYVSYVFAAGVDVALTNKFHLQPEFSFGIEGSKNNSIQRPVNKYYNPETDRNMIYNEATHACIFKLNVMAKYYIIKGLAIMAGPWGAFNDGYVREWTFNGGQHSEQLKYPAEIRLGKDAISKSPGSGLEYSVDRRFEYGLAGGISYQFAPKGLFFDYYFFWGPRNLSKNDRYTVKKDAMQLTVGWRF